ncbi:SusC/RagA family TonB-linked outer membrane protein [Chitinophaga sp. GCM10012297]|uniref:SusC/RagA family TonB-linked outer membrane protein n=1 Tax=Chitinophaga chungangae TaxID=2821488 RepID=A0ABS3Y9Q0_9BACT|nr:SusC/RagA family TonB-linked outer membrane protein [Chitinophaga chungangae]MBO9151361.1 SusC/RagA family TonB-linked outer membrane protein [Chitinophaga chungangae]
MRLTALLVFTAIIQSHATAVAQSVTISGKDMPLKTIFTEIEKQTGYVVFSSNEVFLNAHPVTVRISAMPLADALGVIMKDQPIWYFLDAKSIFLFPENKPAPVAVPQEEPRVKGLVRDTLGRVLYGATVVNQRTKKSVMTDAGGAFEIEAKADDVLGFSFIGFESQLVNVRGRNTVIVLLSNKNSSLDETVVIAYGTTTRRFSTGNITSIKAAEIEKQPVQNPLLALQGRVPGLFIQQQSGYEHGPIRIEVRGRNSINPRFSTDPLFIIDGVPLTVLNLPGARNPAEGETLVSTGLDQVSMSPAGGQNPLYNMNPSDIESIEVLKDADATAIYGSRGSNGVILITTKKGAPGKTRIKVDYSQGVRFVTRRWDMLNTQEYLAMRREAFANKGLTPSPLPGTAAYAADLFAWDTTRYTDWQDYAWGRMGTWNKAQVDISGGTASTNFRIAGGYGRTSDITARSGINQNASLSFSLQHQGSDKRFKLQLTANYGYSDINVRGVGSGPNTSTLPPHAPEAFDEAGRLNFVAWKAGGKTNPFDDLIQPYNSSTNSLQSGLQLSYNIAPRLNAMVNLGYNQNFSNQTRLTPIASIDTTGSTKTGTAAFANTRATNFLVEPQLDYSLDVASGKGRLSVLAGGTFQSNNTNGIRITGTGYTNDALIGSISNANGIASYDRAGQYKYAGVFARIGFRWADRYMLNLNARRDGSSRFGPGNQFGNFGSIGAAWILSEEAAIRSLLPEAISFLKLRGSYGITGSDAAGDYQFVSQWGNLAPKLFPYNGISPLTPQIQPNPYLQWETNRKAEIALEMGFLNDRLNMGVSYYRNQCGNQLVDYPTPLYTGFSSVTANLPAEVLNYGWEGTVGGYVVHGRKFSWRADFNISANRNKLLSYPNIEETPYYDQYIIGEPLSLKFLYHLIGVDPETGKYMYEDYNHDGKITKTDGVQPGSGEDDRYIRVNTRPKFGGGLNNQITYKNWMFSFFFEFTKKMATNYLGGVPGTSANIPRWLYENRWQYPGHMAAAPALTTTGDLTYSNFNLSDANYTDASYIRLRTVALSWSLPEKIAKAAKLTRAAVNLNAQNLFTFTKYQGLDPDVTNFGGMPPVRTITAGLSCTF